MKSFLLTFKSKTVLLILFLLFPIVMSAATSMRSLNNMLQELHLELQTSYMQRQEAQQALDVDYERQHQRMLNVIKGTNELSILLYTQEQRRTLDMSYALHKVTAGYSDFNKDKRPYDRIIFGLDFEIDRYARLIEALRRLPPEITDIADELIPDSLLYHNDSLENYLAGTVSSLEKEIIEIADDDTGSAMYILDEQGNKYRDSCILYTSELLKMYASNRVVVIADSTYYQEAFLRVKETYDYAQERYNDLDKYIYEEGQTPYLEILSDFGYYWSKMKRELSDQYDMKGLLAISDEDSRSYNNLSGLSERAFLIILSVAQLLALAIVWLPILLILWVLKRFTRCRKYLSNIPLTLLSILIGTIVYFLVSDSFASDSDYIRIGVKNINTFLWLLFVISGSLLLRVNSERLNMSGRIYVPTLIISFVIIILRNIFIPDIVLNILLTPFLVIVVLWQLVTCLQVRNKVTRADSLLGWVSLSIYVITLLLSFFGYCFAALQYLVWWFFLLSALLTVFCFSTLLDRFKEKYLNKRVSDMRKRITYAPGNDGETLLFGATWFYDLVKEVIIPTIAVLALPWSVIMSLKLFDLTDLYARYFYEPFIAIPDVTTGNVAFSVSVISIVSLVILFFVMRYLNRAIHALYHYVVFANFMRKHNRTNIRDNEINLSLGNSILSVLIWTIYAVVIINVWKIPTGSLGLVAGGLSAGIGIALKDIINNFIYGIQLMGGRLRVGDWIECDGVRGKVTAINYQCVQVETLNNTEMSFLNESLFGKSFNNLTRNNSYELTKIVASVAYGTDVEKARNVIVEAMQVLRTKDSYGRDIVHPDKGIYVVMGDMSESSVDLVVRQKVLVAEQIPYVYKAKEIIYNALNEAGISIPFPQCDVHLISDK